MQNEECVGRGGSMHFINMERSYCASKYTPPRGIKGLREQNVHSVCKVFRECSNIRAWEGASVVFESGTIQAQRRTVVASGTRLPLTHL